MSALYRRFDELSVRRDELSERRDELSDRGAVTFRSAHTGRRKMVHRRSDADPGASYHPQETT
jgi:hypothetical protein